MPLYRFLSQHHIISIGAVLGFASRGFNTTNLTWDKRWNGDTVLIPNLPSGEQFDLLRTNFIENGRIELPISKDERTHVDMASVLHLIEPQVSHYDADKH